MQVSVLIPAYREKEKIISGLKDLFITLDFLQVEYEVIVIVDGDPETLEVLKTFSHPKLKIFTYEKNRGKGYALVYGFKKSLGNVLIFWDAGTQISQESLKLAWRTFSFSEADVVVGSKRHPLSKVEYPLKRQIYSFICQIAAYLVFGLTIKDTQTGLKIFKREILEKIAPKIRTRGYAVDIEMLVATRSLGYKKIIETPVDLSHFKFGGGVNYKAVYKVAIDMVKTFWRLSTGFYTVDKKPNLFLTVDLEKDPWTGKIPETETLTILEHLKNADKKITFFVSGEIYDEKPELVKRLISEGHEVGLHSYSHQKITSLDILEEELTKSQKFIKDITPKGFRAPFVYLPQGGLAVLKKFGFQYDSSSTFCQRIVKNSIFEFPVSAVKIKMLGNKVFKLPLGFAECFKGGMLPLGSGLITALTPNLQIKLLKKYDNCLLFLHPWQFTKHTPLSTLIKNPNLLLYRRNCSKIFEIMVKEFNLRRLDERLYEKKLQIPSN